MAFFSPLLRLVLVVLVMVAALAAGMLASSAFTGWLFLGVAFVGGPVAAIVDGWARSRRRGAGDVARTTSSVAARVTGAVSPSVCRPAAGAASAW
jgi:membrane protein implicated in regulation of membrane protease activity